MFIKSIYFCEVKKKNFLIHQLKIEDYAAEGKSIARLDGKVVFIDGGVPGDVADIWITKSKKDWAEGRIDRLINPSKQRIDSFCEHFGICGGCKWQMLPYEQQLIYKQKEIEDNLTRIGKINIPTIQLIIGSTKTQYYRNKLEFTFSEWRYKTRVELQQEDGLDAKKELGALGFHVPKIFDKVIDIETCYLQPAPSNDLRNAVRAFAHQHQLSFYNVRLHTGWLRNMMIRTCTTGEWMVNMVLAYEDEIIQKKLLDFIIQQFPTITSLYFTINGKLNDSLYDLIPQLYYGKPYIQEKLDHFIFNISPKSFFQTNTKQAENLYRVTRNFAELTGKEIVYDLYCGTGSIGLFVSPMAAKIIGIETVNDAVKDAQLNATINNIQHAHFITGDVVKICTDDFFIQHGKPSVIITDPPRAGMHEKLVRKLLDIQAPIIVYVSCNTATQARDLQLLNEKYTVAKVQPVDMFPHTHHIENVVQLRIK